MAPIVLGTGELAWPSAERHTDRYGVVHLNNEGTPQQIDTSLVGRRGRLVAVFPDGHSTNFTINVGDEIELGNGTLFVETSQAGDTEVGVKPEDGRAEHWLDGEALTACDGQVVRLEFHPAPLRVGEIKIQFRPVPDGERWRVFIERTTTTLVEVTVPHADLNHTHNPDSVTELHAKLDVRALELAARGEATTLAGPVHESSVITSELEHEGADEARANLISRYSGDADNAVH